MLYFPRKIDLFLTVGKGGGDNFFPFSSFLQNIYPHSHSPRVLNPEKFFPHLFFTFFRIGSKWGKNFSTKFPTVLTLKSSRKISGGIFFVFSVNRGKTQKLGNFTKYSPLKTRKTFII